MCLRTHLHQISTNSVDSTTAMGDLLSTLDVREVKLRLTKPLLIVNFVVTQMKRNCGFSCKFY